MKNEKKTFVDPFAHIHTDLIVRNLSFWLNAMMSRGVALDQVSASVPDTDAVSAPSEDSE